MRNYGIDNICVDEGKNGMINVVFVTYNWRVNRIIQEFATDEAGNVSKEMIAKLPSQIQIDYKGNNVNKTHKIIQAVYPREDFDPKLKGKRGAKYRGSWFKYEDATNIFHEEDFKVFPIAIARAIKVRGEIYGRASGTIIMGTIASVDYMVSQTFQILEKMQSPPMGTWNSALFGDSVLDTSADGLTVFNQEMLGQAKDPVFKVQDIGDPSGIVSFLLPYLNEKITTAFKVDVLLDFNAGGDRTATEMMQRAIIRGKNLSGMLQQQKVELYDRWLDRSISLLWQVRAYGVAASQAPDIAVDYIRRDKVERIIPEAVLECEKQGIKWYKIRYNGELDRLTKTEALDKIMTLLNGVGAIMKFFPAIAEAVNWYDMMVDINKYLGVSYFKSEKEFEAAIARTAQIQQTAALAQMQESNAKSEKDRASAHKSNSEARK